MGRIKRYISNVLMQVLNTVRGVIWDRSTSLVNGLSGLDIGCGNRKRVGFLGLDSVCVDGVDVVCDIENNLLPFRDNTFDVISALHVLEHISDLNAVLDELSRVLKPGGRLQITTPYAGDLRAFQDPTHVRYFTIKTFEYFVAEGARVGGWYTKKSFRRITRRSLVFSRGPISLLVSLIVNRSIKLLDFYESSPLRIIIARDIQVELEK